MADIEEQLNEVLEENRRISEKLEEKERFLDEADEQIRILSDSLEKEKQYSSELSKKVIQLSDELAKYSVKADDIIEEKEIVIDSNGIAESVDDLEKELRRGSMTPISDLMLSCTLCGERIKIEELEPHSSKCSSDNGNKENNQEPTTPTLPGMLVATVTTSRRESMLVENECPAFRVICKTTIPDFKKPLLVTERTKEDFLWFQNALEQLNPERIIPPLHFKDNLTDNLMEAQRFLSRICVHCVLKSSSLTRKFFECSSRELEKIKKTFHRRIPFRLKHQKPAVEVVDKDGLIFRSQTYISQLRQNLESLVNNFTTGQEKQYSNGLSQCFLALSYGETNETYLQTVAKALSNIIGNLENKRDRTYDDSVFAGDLQSILEFAESADGLLTRVEDSINTYLYWEEEIRVFEEMKVEGLVTSTNGKSITQLWAEASSNCRTAKTELENICKDLSNELTSFDLRKEHELKQVFIEYAESRYDLFETMQSKWFGVKLMLNADIQPELRAIDLSM